MYKAQLIAYLFVKKAIADGNPVTQMKLQKLIYFAEGVHLAMYGRSLIYDSIQAWKFGPVIPSVHSDYKLYGAQPISDFIWLSNNQRDYYESELAQLDNEALSTVNMTWDALKNWDAGMLSTWSHMKDSPWEKNYKAGVTDIVIPKKEMEQYFQQYIEK